MVGEYVPKHMAPPGHDLSADTLDDCPGCVDGDRRAAHPFPPAYAARWDDLYKVTPPLTVEQAQAIARFNHSDPIVRPDPTRIVDEGRDIPDPIDLLFLGPITYEQADRLRDLIDPGVAGILCLTSDNPAPRRPRWWNRRSTR